MPWPKRARNEFRSGTLITPSKLTSNADAEVRPVAAREEPVQVVVGAVLLDQEDDVLDRCPARGDGKRRSVRGGCQGDDDVRPPRRLAVVVDREERDHDDREERPGRCHDPSATGPWVHMNPE
jgi:hypothetical protein